MYSASMTINSLFTKVQGSPIGNPREMTKQHKVEESLHGLSLLTAMLLPYVLNVHTVKTKVFTTHHVLCPNTHTVYGLVCVHTFIFKCIQPVICIGIPTARLLSLIDLLPKDTTLSILDSI